MTYSSLVAQNREEIISNQTPVRCFQLQEEFATELDFSTP